VEAVTVRLTLTSRACPLGEMVLGEVRQKMAQCYPEVTRMGVQPVWSPAWTPDRITDRGCELLDRPEGPSGGAEAYDGPEFANGLPARPGRARAATIAGLTGP